MARLLIYGGAFPLVSLQQQQEKRLSTASLPSYLSTADTQNWNQNHDDDTCHLFLHRLQCPGASKKFLLCPQWPSDSKACRLPGVKPQVQSSKSLCVSMPSKEQWRTHSRFPPRRLSGGYRRLPPASGGLRPPAKCARVSKRVGECCTQASQRRAKAHRMHPMPPSCRPILRGHQ